MPPSESGINYRAFDLTTRAQIDDVLSQLVAIRGAHPDDNNVLRCVTFGQAFQQVDGATLDQMENWLIDARSQLRHYGAQASTLAGVQRV